jgi:hypothetical protein
MPLLNLFLPLGQKNISKAIHLKENIIIGVKAEKTYILSDFHLKSISTYKKKPLLIC